MSVPVIDEVVAIADESIRKLYLNTTHAGKVAITNFVLDRQAWKHRKPDAYAALASLCAAFVAVLATLLIANIVR